VKVLLDHNLQHKLRANLGMLGKHEIVTASYMRWGDLKNGELLRAAEDSGIEVLLPGIGAWSMSRTSPAGDWRLWLSTNNWPIVKNHLPQILAAIDSAVPGSFQAVACGMFSRKTGPSG